MKILKEWGLINLPFSVRGTCSHGKANELKLTHNAISLAKKQVPRTWILGVRFAYPWGKFISPKGTRNAVILVPK